MFLRFSDRFLCDTELSFCVCESRFCADWYCWKRSSLPNEWHSSHEFLCKSSILLVFSVICSHEKPLSNADYMSTSIRNNAFSWIRKSKSGTREKRFQKGERTFLVRQQEYSGATTRETCYQDLNLEYGQHFFFQRS